ncbi:hypothetical protein GE21DRAFT_3218 [Neurospora crassa]|uniref:CDP-2-and HDA-1 associating protein n=2 Tax=Neurospora crassa TaxID=5141 RepID=Q1K551_NEUCR|nr:CDP-2- and HDA-1 associating protein [Neurospora crassa OR74A]EAA27238.1 CDP-2- and HDA-1 associating protein [Neurospora crassa OR74A]KHE79399.1 hypothetical protein GE21DRAFT_3218 [Neurospora crassa]CAD21181.1 putative protein [Neurospora crassa]|eukprot:XP_956474.1 CDP-2- and HDA-1 associating protein [Neurospora crassa OR74A]
MPYDPDLYPDDDPIDNFNYDPKDDYDELGDDYDPDLDPNQQGDHEEDVDEFYDAEDVEDEPSLQAPVKVPQHPRRATLSPLQPSRSERHATPTSTSVRDGTPRSARVAVMLPVSVKKEAYISVPDVASDEEEEEEEKEKEEDTMVGSFVTSDLMPPTPKRRKITERPSTKPTPTVPAPNYVPPKVQPPPFPIPDIPAPVPLVNPTKKRGRPFGWRPGLSYAAMRGNPVPPPRPKVPKQPKAPSEVKRRGRPPKKPHELPREIFSKLTPRYIRFLCEWEGCPAELHNFETLRKHVLVVHGDYRQPHQHHLLSAREQPQEPKTCKWASCHSKRLQSELPPLTLPTRSHFEAHVNESHLIPFLWHVGDGPRNTSIESPLSEKPLTITSALPSQPLSSSSISHLDVTTTTTTNTTTTSTAIKLQPLPPYLFDTSGNQVTPSVRDQLYENDDDKRRRRVRLERVHFLRDENAAPEPVYTQAERDAMEASLAAKKKKQDEFWEYYEKVMGPVVEVTVLAADQEDLEVPENASGNLSKEVKRKMLSCGWDPQWRGLYQD